MSIHEGVTSPVSLANVVDVDTLYAGVTFYGPPSRDQLLEMLSTLPPEAICLVGYVGEDGDYHALKAADLTMLREWAEHWRKSG